MIVELRATELPGRTCGPHRHVEVGLQVREEVVEIVAGDVPSATWRVEVERTADGDFRGPAVHGKRGERFLYLVWLERASPVGPRAMFRRAKIQLDAVPAGDRVVGELGLTDAKGMPRCASVRPPLIRWAAAG